MGLISKELSRMEIVMAASSCRKHAVEVGEPCWWLPIQNGKGKSPAVCGARVKRAGFTGGISTASVRQTPSARYK